MKYLYVFEWYTVSNCAKIKDYPHLLRWWNLKKILKLSVTYGKKKKSKIDTMPACLFYLKYWS